MATYIHFYSFHVGYYKNLEKRFYFLEQCNEQYYRQIYLFLMACYYDKILSAYLASGVPRQFPTQELTRLNVA